MVTATGIYNVKDYGATGDGAHDDTPGVQTALSLVAEAGGGDWRAVQFEAV